MKTLDRSTPTPPDPAPAAKMLYRFLVGGKILLAIVFGVVITANLGIIFAGIAIAILAVSVGVPLVALAAFVWMRRSSFEAASTT